ncbi:MAG: NADH-quinone oxidoreductase subunit A [Vampirovibrionales bacterium]|nr:NADH-quinone oxidoreductase subunit A [Vampirovibrionales bacterium]
MLLTGYPLLFLLLLFAAITPFLLLGLSQVVQIKSPNVVKNTAYESGMPVFGDSHIQFDIKFYLFALLFLLFDIETIFLYPWAVSFADLACSKEVPSCLGAFPIVEMFFFIGVLLLGLIYAWKRDALKWQ